MDSVKQIPMSVFTEIEVEDSSGWLGISVKHVRCFKTIIIENCMPIKEVKIIMMKTIYLL